MYLIRRFEEGAEESYMRGLIHGTMHLSIGQEASALGICMPLTDDDQITSTHRGHGHCIAKGAEVKRMFAEFFGKTTAIAAAAADRCTLPTWQRAIWAPTASSAADFPIAVGAALSAKKMKNGKVVVSFFGDGANNEGAFHEALNMASIWKLPVVFVCENNGYGMSTSTERSTAVKNIAERAAAYSMPGVIVDGNIFSEVADASHKAVERARAGEGPTLIEIQDLSSPRPFQERPQPVPHQGGDRRLDVQSRPDRVVRGGVAGIRRSSINQASRQSARR